MMTDKLEMPLEQFAEAVAKENERLQSQYDIALGGIRVGVERIKQLTSGPGGIMEMKQTISDREAELNYSNLSFNAQVEENYLQSLDIERLEAVIARLEKYESMVHYIANDYIELSYEKAQCQRDDWLKRCRKTIAEAPLEWTENYGQGSEPWLNKE